MMIQIDDNVDTIKKYEVNIMDSNEFSISVLEELSHLIIDMGCDRCKSYIGKCLAISQDTLTPFVECDKLIVRWLQENRDKKEK